MEIIIIGAGLVGLTAAICLARKGHSVKVVERQAQLWTVGGAINLTSGATTVLNMIGLKEALGAASDVTLLATQRDIVSGDLFRSVPLSKGDRISRTILRPDLLKLLYDEAIRLNVAVEFSSTVVDLAETSVSATAMFEGGRVAFADLIIAADGVRSRMRYKILGDIIPDPSQLDAEHSDRIYYVVNFPSEKLSSLQGLNELLAPNRLNFWMGRDDQFALSLYNPTPKNMTVVYCVREPVDMTSLWDENGDINYVRGKFAGKCHPDLERALQAADHCERWRLSQMPDLPRWRSAGGRMILFGDAVHAMHPTAGQGYSSSVQEVAALEYLLETYPTNIPEATRLWEELSKPTSNRLKQFGHFLSRQYEGDQEALAQAIRGNKRDMELRKTDPDLEHVVPDLNAEFAGPEFYCFVLRYDSLQAAKDYVKHMGQNGA